jgi:hypothetical protein
MKTAMIDKLLNRVAELTDDNFSSPDGCGVSRKIAYITGKTFTDAECEKLLSELQAVNNTPTWISVKDKLPDGEYSVLLVTCKFGNIERFNQYQLGYYCPFDKKPHWELDDAPIGIDFEDNPDYIQVTHWMPLPKLPTVENALNTEIKQDIKVEFTEPLPLPKALDFIKHQRANSEPTTSDTPIVGWIAKSKGSELMVRVTDGAPLDTGYFCGEVIDSSRLFNVGDYSNCWSIKAFTFHKPTTA